MALYGEGLLQLPLSSPAEVFKCSKVKLKPALYHSDIVGQVQHGRIGLGMTMQE